MALTAWTSLVTALKSKAQSTMLCCKGSGDNELYAIEVNPTNGAIPVTPTSSVGMSAIQLIRNDYTSTNVTTSAYVTLVASTSGIINSMNIFDSSGAALKIAVGAAASEVDQVYVFPGGVPAAYALTIPAGSRLSIKSVDTATVNTGQLLITTLG